MKKSFLKCYDKMLIASLSALLALVGGCTKKNVEKPEKIVTNKNSVKKNDSVPVYKNPKFKDREVIAMYGVRPDRLTK